MRKISIWAIIVLAGFVFFTVLPNETSEKFDPYIVGIISGSLAGVSVVMVAATRHWTFRAIGVLSVAMGTSVIYTGSLLFFIFPELAPEYAEVFRDVGRTLLGVGGPILLLSVFSYSRGDIDNSGPFDRE